MTTDDGYDEPPPSRRFSVIFAVAMAVVAVGWIWVWQARTERIVIEPVPPVAVAGVDMPAGEHVTERTFVEQLATSFAQIRGLEVTPMEDLYAAAAGGSGAAAMVSAARQLEVPQVLQGTLRRVDDGYRLELQRVDAVTRAQYGKVTAEGRTHDELVRSITAHLAMSLGLAIPR